MLKGDPDNQIATANSWMPFVRAYFRETQEAGCRRLGKKNPGGERQRPANDRYGIEAVERRGKPTRILSREQLWVKLGTIRPPIRTNTRKESEA